MSEKQFYLERSGTGARHSPEENLITKYDEERRNLLPDTQMKMAEVKKALRYNFQDLKDI